MPGLAPALPQQDPMKMEPSLDQFPSPKPPETWGWRVVVSLLPLSAPLL